MDSYQDTEKQTASLAKGGPHPKTEILDELIRLSIEAGKALDWHTIKHLPGFDWQEILQVIGPYSTYERILKEAVDQYQASLLDGQDTPADENNGPSFKIPANYSKQSERPSRPTPASTEQPEQSEQSEHSEHPEELASLEHSEYPEQPEHAEHLEHSEQSKLSVHQPEITHDLNQSEPSGALTIHPSIQLPKRSTIMRQTLHGPLAIEVVAGPIIPKSIRTLATINDPPIRFALDKKMETKNLKEEKPEYILFLYEIEPDDIICPRSLSSPRLSSSHLECCNILEDRYGLAKYLTHLLLGLGHSITKTFLTSIEVYNEKIRARCINYENAAEQTIVFSFPVINQRHRYVMMLYTEEAADFVDCVIFDRVRTSAGVQTKLIAEHCPNIKSTHDISASPQT